MTPALVLLNPAARGGTAVDRFARVRDRLRERFRLRVVETDPTGEWRSAVWDAIRADGLRVVVAAGGDGTVHAVVNTLFDLGAPRGLVLGAIGLGSSNDYHKPVRAEIAGIPVRLDVANARPRDLLLARWDRDGIAQREVVVVSASLGVTAAANAFFNRGDAILRVLKGRWTAGAIAYAALRTLVTHPGSRGSVILEGERWSGSLANLSFLEAPYLSGSLRYDLPAAEDDGHVTVALIRSGGRLRLLYRLAGLYRGRFRGSQGTHHWIVSGASVRLDEPGALELDGEVRTTRRVRFDVLPRRLSACP